MKATYVPDQLTPWTLKEAVDGFSAAFFEQELVAPSRATLCVLVAQSALETGRWHSCHVNNLGNSKAGPLTEGFFTSFKCNEVLKGVSHWYVPEGEVDYATYKAYRPGQPVTLLPNAQRFTPDPGHPTTRFQAFPTPAAGLKKHLAKLKEKWPAAWQAALRGDVRGFAHALHVGGYYTANEQKYTDGIASIFAEYMANPVTDLGAAPTPSPPPLPSPAIHRRTLGLGAKDGPGENDVATAQRLLGVKIDGDFGKLTARALLEFQRAHGLKPDAILGARSWSVLLAIPSPPEAA